LEVKLAAARVAKTGKEAEHLMAVQMSQMTSSDCQRFPNQGKPPKFQVCETFIERRRPSSLPVIAEKKTEMQ